MAGFQFVKVSSSNYFCSQGKLIGSEAATLFIPHRYATYMKIPPTVVTFLLIYAGVTYSQVRRIDKIVKGTGSKDTTIIYAKDSCY
jgi:hypothetical protein